MATLIHVQGAALWRWLLVALLFWPLELVAYGVARLSAGVSMMLIYTTLVKGSVRFCILHAHYNTCGTHSQCRPGRPSATFGSSLPQITERWIAGPAALADSFADKYSLLTSLHGPEDNTTPIHVAHRTRPVKIPTSVLHRSPTHPHKSSAVARNHNQKSLRLHAVPLMQWLWVHTPSPPLHVQP